MEWWDELKSSFQIETQGDRKKFIFQTSACLLRKMLKIDAYGCNSVIKDHSSEINIFYKLVSFHKILPLPFV